VWNTRPTRSSSLVYSEQMTQGKILFENLFRFKDYIGNKVRKPLPHDEKGRTEGLKKASHL